MVEMGLFGQVVRVEWGWWYAWNTAWYAIAMLGWLVIWVVWFGVEAELIRQRSNALAAAASASINAHEETLEASVRALRRRMESLREFVQTVEVEQWYRWGSRYQGQFSRQSPPVALWLLTQGSGGEVGEPERARNED